MHMPINWRSPITKAYHSSPASTYLGPTSGLNQAPAGFNGQYQGDFNMFLQAPSELDQVG